MLKSFYQSPLVLLACLLSSRFCSADDRSKTPNIVIIYADDKYKLFGSDVDNAVRSWRFLSKMYRSEPSAITWDSVDIMAFYYSLLHAWGNPIG
jgi:hypothetical protein